MGQTYSNVVFKITLELNDKNLGLTFEKLKHFPLVSLHHPIRAITKRLAQPPVIFFTPTGTLTSFEEYNARALEYVPANEAKNIKHRSYDGYGNNRENLWLGQGKRGYGLHMHQSDKKTVFKSKPVDILTDLAIRKTFQPAPHDVNALVPFFALLVIHEFFRSDSGRGKESEVDRNYINLHSSYLDLQCLYGYSEELNKTVRTFTDGKLIADKIADNRLERLFITKSLVVLFNREHNKICDEIKKRYPERCQTDEDTFQLARLINCGVFINCIKREYTTAIAGIVPKNGGTGAFLEGCTGPKYKDAKGFHCTMEFNLMYRFHATIPDALEITEVDPAKPMSIEAALKVGLSAPAGRFGAFHIPEYMVPAEAAAVNICRDHKLKSFNEFRASLGLDKHSFGSFSKDPEVEKVLRKHYDSPDDVEMSIGLIAEDQRQVGWGLPGTMLFAILADAAGCLSHDRFYTTDFTPEVYSEWGMKYLLGRTTVDLVNDHTEITLPKEIVLTEIPKTAAPKKSSQVVPV